MASSALSIVGSACCCLRTRSKRNVEPPTPQPQIAQEFVPLSLRHRVDSESEMQALASELLAISTDSPYRSQQLASGEIRLLTIASTESGLALSTEPHKVTEDLLFDAVSYVWGTAPATVETTCNGKPFLVTPTAHEMLVYLHRFRPSPQRPLWIDAICINQGDANEKSIQVPFMSRIFSRAAQVIIWMGPSTPGTEVFMAELPRVSKIAKGWISTEIDLFILWSTNGWPRDDDPFWSGCFHLASREWFWRLWTFQEAVLARKAIVLSGASWIDLDIFLDFVVSGHFGARVYLPPHPPQSDRLAWDEIYTIRVDRERIINQGIFVEAFNIPFLVYDMRNRHVKEKVDRVWAINGLFEKDVQDVLAPKVDYSVEARKEYSKTFIDLAKVVLSRPGGLNLLLIPPSLGPKNDSLPSWCPDFAGQSACWNLISDRWNISVSHSDQHHATLLREDDDDEDRSWKRISTIKNHSRRSVWTLETDNILRVRGFCVDTVSEVVEDSRLLSETDFKMNSGWKSYNNQNPSHVAAMSWESRSLALARRILHGADKTTSSVPSEYLMAILLDVRISEEAAITYTDAMSIYKSEDPMSQYLNLGRSRRARASRFRALMEQLSGHTFFSTTGGRIGIATPGCKPGDKVCVFYGGDPLHVLRWPGCGDSDNISPGGAVVEFIGVAFVPHLMDQHTSDDARLGEDELYAIG